MTYVPPEINQPGPGHILIIGRDPGEREEEEGYPFAGPAGDELDYVLSNAGVRRQDCNIANVVGYRPPGNDFKKHDEGVIKNHQTRLYKLIKRLRPSLIVTLGNEAAYTLVPDWPTAGRGVMGAKGIEDRRGYFWDGPMNTTVLTTLHPAGVLRRMVPGRYLLETDFRRARMWLNGDLPREEFPEHRMMTQADVWNLEDHKIIAFDIETRNENTQLLCCGFCGDDRVPIVSHFMDYRKYAAPVLKGRAFKCAHNGQFDIYDLWKMKGTRIRNYGHDTQTAWYALEPELAGRDESGGEGKYEAKGRMTRKGLAFLASLYMNVPWWKNYPPAENPHHMQLMLELNGRDVWVTRELIDSLLWEITQKDVWPQYRLAMDLLKPCLAIQERGLPINEVLREERYRILSERVKEQESLAVTAGLAYIEEHKVESFQDWRKCQCCGGGTKQRIHCWKCSGEEGDRPKKKTEWPEHRIEAVKKVLGLDKSPTVKQLTESLVKCRNCQADANGRGKVVSYHFNPFSEKQMKDLLYDTLNTPNTVWKGKTTVDETALKKVLQWAKAGKSGAGN